jgi:hypothetical protein
LLSTYTDFDKFGNKFAYKLQSIISSKDDVSLDEAVIKALSDSDSNYKAPFKGSDFSDNDKIFVLENLREELRREFTQFKSKGRVYNEISILMDLVENAISILKNREINFEKDISKLGWSSGSMLVSLDLIPNQNARIIHRLVNDGFDKIHTRFNTFNSSFRSKINKLKEAKGYSTAEALTSGYANRIYNNLFRLDDKGELLDGDLILKNP